MGMHKGFHSMSEEEKQFHYWNGPISRWMITHLGMFGFIGRIHSFTSIVIVMTGFISLGIIPFGGAAILCDAGYFRTGIALIIYFMVSLIDESIHEGEGRLY